MFSNVNLVGRIGNIKATTTSGGTPVCTMSLAVERYFKNEKVTDWHRVVCYGKLAERCNEYLKNGRLIVVNGELQNRSYTDRDNVKRYVTEIVASVVKFADNKAKPAADVPETEDLPF